MSDSCDHEPEQSLCQSCGLCCRGIVLSGVRLMEDERAWAIARRIDVHETARGPAFALPCREYAEGGCVCYAERPRACRAFRCSLLVDLQAARIDFRSARAIVRELAEDVAVLDSMFCGPSRASFWRVAAHAADPGSCPELKRQLIASMGEAGPLWLQLRAKLDRHIHRPSVESPIEANDS